MGFWWFLFICDLLIPILMIILGKVMWKYPPKNINYVFGYRTAQSMKNMDTWKFAHECCGRLWWKIGWVLLVVSILVQIPFYNSTENMIGIVCGIVCSVQCIVLLVPVFITERALKKKFPE